MNSAVLICKGNKDREGSPPREAKAAVPAHLEHSKDRNLSVRERARKALELTTGKQALQMMT